jgi:ankyrin repeat protein
MQPAIKELIEQSNYAGLRQVLSQNPGLANEGIPYDEKNTSKAHPLHRICDAVFLKRITDEEAVEIARIFIESGAYIDGYEVKETKDTPLIAAASLHAEKLGLYYLQNGADIHHAGCYGGTALHWASWCGRDQLVKELIHSGADMNRKCIEFGASPLGWAVHGYKSGGETNRYHQTECARILIEAGADKTIANASGEIPLDLLSDGDVELKKLFN